MTSDEIKELRKELSEKSNDVNILSLRLSIEDEIISSKKRIDDTKRKIEDLDGTTAKKQAEADAKKEAEVKAEEEARAKAEAERIAEEKATAEETIPPKEE